MLSLNKESIAKFLFNSSLFRIVYIIDLFLGMLAFLEGFSIFLKCFILSWGAIILIHNFFINKKFTKVNHYKILFLFLFSCIITTFINFEYNFLPDFLAVYHIAVCFFIFYGMYPECDKKTIEKEMIIIFKFVIWATTILSFIGILIFIFFIQINIGDFWLGIFNNRLIGVFWNSNLLALCNAVSIIFTHTIFTTNLKNSVKSTYGIKAIYVLSVMLNFACLVLSDSNASFLFLLIYIIVMLFYVLFAKEKCVNIKMIIKKSSILLICCLLLAVSSFLFRGFCQSRVALFVTDVHQSAEPVQDNRTAQEDLVIGRENYDISSGRFRLLKQAAQMYKNHPVMGIGRGNVVKYGELELEHGLAFSDFHNGYVTILVSWGAVGFLIFMVFSFLVAVRMCKNLFNKDNVILKTPFPNLFSILCGYSIYSLFEKTILSEITFMAVIFWLILGYASVYVNNNFTNFLLFDNEVKADSDRI